MTNLRNGVSPALLSRDRILVGVPLLIGVLLALGVGVGILRPTLERVDSLEDRLVDLQDQQRSFPGLERRLIKAQASLSLRQQKQAVLLDLIAGRDRIQTFLALLGQEAHASGVDIRRYEPLAAPPSAKTTGRRSRSSETTKPESAKTPMQELGYHQSSIALQVSGGYAGLQQFLQRMERLQLLVESSELSLKTTPAAKQDQDESVSLEPAPTELSLRLTFYDRRPEGESKNAGAQRLEQPESKAPS
jgi:type IV pilus assembly protein PilO